MTLVDLFALGDKYNREGETQMAVKLWGDVVKNDPHVGIYAAAHINLADSHKKAGNLVGERNELVAFLNSAQSAVTLRLVPQVEGRVAEIETKLKPKPNPAVEVAK